MLRHARLFEEEQPSPSKKEIAPRKVGADGSLPLLVAFSFSALSEESGNDGNIIILGCREAPRKAAAGGGAP